MDKAIRKIHEAVLSMDNDIPLDKFEDNYKKQKELNDIYNDLNECERRLRILNDE